MKPKTKEDRVVEAFKAGKPIDNAIARAVRESVLTGRAIRRVKGRLRKPAQAKV
jgi:hypothetical protein